MNKSLEKCNYPFTEPNASLEGGRTAHVPSRRRVSKYLSSGREGSLPGTNRADHANQSFVGMRLFRCVLCRIDLVWLPFNTSQLSSNTTTSSDVPVLREGNRTADHRPTVVSSGERAAGLRRECAALEGGVQQPPCHKPAP